jgi:hypothetical protein
MIAFTLWFWISKSRDSESDDGISGTATVNYLGTAKMIRIGVDIQNQRVNAIIDTGSPTWPCTYLGNPFPATYHNQ